jgi:hypothetical protein
MMADGGGWMTSNYVRPLSERRSRKSYILYMPLGMPARDLKATTSSNTYYHPTLPAPTRTTTTPLETCTMFFHSLLGLLLPSGDSYREGPIQPKAKQS